MTTTRRGLIKIYGGGKTPCKVYNRQQMDLLISLLMQQINKKLAVLTPDPSGKRWVVEHNMWPAREWEEDGSQWVIGPIIVERDPEVSKSFDGSEWVVDQNLFPLVNERRGGINWEIRDIIVDNDLAKITSGDQIGSIWEDVRHNLFPSPEEKIDGINWEIRDIIIDRDIERITSTDPIGSIWDNVRFNLFPLVEEREGGDQWVVEENIEFPWQSAL